MVNILCVHWGNKYNGTYVNRLYRMVSKNLTLPFNFYCYSNNNFEYNKNFLIVINIYKHEIFKQFRKKI